MAKSLITIVNELHKVSSVNDKKRLSELASYQILEAGSEAGSFLLPIVDRVVFRLGGPFEEIASDEFYELNVIAYCDVDDLMKFSIRMSFLQDFENTVEGLDKEVAENLMSDVKRRNLDIVVNDICVNTEQYRDGVRL